MENIIDKPSSPIESNKETEQGIFWNELLSIEKNIERRLGVNGQSSKEETDLDIPITNRDMEEIRREHNLSKEDFLQMEGKRILDLGMGHSSFGSELKKTIKCEFFSLDRKKLLDIYPIPRELFKDSNLVVGDMNNIPFANNSMDVIFATYSFPYWALSPEPVKKFFEEVLRVIRVGGTIYISPIFGSYTNPDPLRHTITNNIELLDLETIRALKKIKETGVGQVELKEEYNAISDNKKRIPHSVSIKKLK